MRQILEKCWEQNIEIHHLFVDFKSVYDSVWKVKEEIWYDMHKLDFPRKLVNLCKVLNKEVYAVVKIGKQITEDFKLSKGLRQRDTIAPII
jgi:outer membrane receptor for ferric coprogen and ferric-rhodotorulic acid